MIKALFQHCFPLHGERPSKISLFNFVRKHITPLPDDAILLDGACQNAWHVSFLFPHKINYIGIDIDEHCIIECRQKFPQFTFHHCALENLSSCVAKGDIFVSTNTFCYISFENIEKIYQELQKVLTDGATILVSTHYKKNYAANIQRFISIFEKYFSLKEVMYYGNALSSKFEDLCSTNGYYKTSSHPCLQAIGENLLISLEKMTQKNINMNKGVACYGVFKKNI